MNWKESLLAKDLSIWNLLWSSPCYKALRKYFHRQKFLCTERTFNKGFGFAHINEQHSPSRKGSLGRRGPDGGGEGGDAEGGRNGSWCMEGKGGKGKAVSDQLQPVFSALNAFLQLERISYAPAPGMHLLVEAHSEGICSAAPRLSLMRMAGQGAGRGDAEGGGGGGDKKGSPHLLQNALPIWTDMLKLTRWCWCTPNPCNNRPLEAEVSQFQSKVNT